jgi:hypothetical protein
MNMTSAKAWSLAGVVTGILAIGVALKQGWIDASSGAALMGAASYLLGRLQTELLPHPKRGRRAGDPRPPEEEDVPPVAP